MRKIGLAAEKQGLDVEYVLCSGDPDSLDGVYIPALKTAWVDGTVPHVTEPVCFGVDSDYVNLGRFCRLPFSPEEKEEIQRINTSYKLLYARAYGYLIRRRASRQRFPSRTFRARQSRPPLADALTTSLTETWAAPFYAAAKKAPDFSAR